MNIYGIKNGKIFGITYKTDKPSVDGSYLVKVTAVTARTGINPTHTKDYVPSANPRKANPNDTIVKPFSIKRIANTGSELMGIYPNWKQSHTKYYKDGEEVSKAVFTASMRPSKSASSEPPKYITIKTENIISIRQK